MFRQTEMAVGNSAVGELTIRRTDIVDETTLAKHHRQNIHYSKDH